jgi:hypothetical protein
MKASKMVGLFVLLASVFAGNAWADGYRGHSHGYRHGGGSVQFGVYVGAPWGYPPYPVYPVYPQLNYWPQVYMPPILVAPPSVYVEQQRTIPALEAGFWYYCNESRTYYPHVQQCAVPWQKVSPTPPR